MADESAGQLSGGSAVVPPAAKIDDSVLDALEEAFSTRIDRSVAKKSREVEQEFLRLLQIVDQRLNAADKTAQKVSAVESRVAALERKVKG